MKPIPYTTPHFAEEEIAAVNDLISSPEKFFTEEYTKKCRQQLENYYGRDVILTHSCTAALEISALLLDLRPGDEVILPSYTFVSTANAFALFGAKLVFVDIEEDTLNLDIREVEAAITCKTKAIVAVHYAAMSCDMEKLLALANEHNIPVIEDAAQCIGAKYQTHHLGTLGALGALSFHNTKNITSGLGGALIVNDEKFLARAKVICQKGTNREAFLEGRVDKYTWQDVGSSYMMSELSAALLSGQLARLPRITAARMALWNHYHTALATVAKQYGYRRPTVPDWSTHNAHIYYLLAATDQQAIELRKYLQGCGITAPFHYIPLHLAPAGKRFATAFRSLPITEGMYQRIVRLPLWEGVEQDMERIIDSLHNGLSAQQSISA